MNRYYDSSIQEGMNLLPTDEAKHCAQVLRQKEGDEILVMDGVGGLYASVLRRVSKREVEYEVYSVDQSTERLSKIHLAIAPTKNMDRMEWLVEKLSEIGVDRISFLETQNSERRKLRMDRLEKKAVSAMKQSGNPFLLKIGNLLSFDSIVSEDTSEIKLIAHVDKDHQYVTELLQPSKNITILIGPEGDFTEDEVKRAQSGGFAPISLGHNTLRTETAGFVACCFVNMINRV